MRTSASYLIYAAIALLAAACSDDGGSGSCETNADCSDGLFCNGAEVCNDDGTCSAGTAPQVDDGIDCTVDSCDETSKSVINAPDDSVCSDDLFCNGLESCNQNLGCMAGTPPTDGIACTDDMCDEENDQIVGIPNDANCDDGAFCNGRETCSVGPNGGSLGCQAGTPPVINDDGVTCTDDFCDEDLDMVVNMPNDANCDDALFCNGPEFCDPVVDCQPGPVPSDGVFCTDDICDEATDTIMPTPNDANCDDALFCNGAETCDMVADCQPGTPVNVDDGVVCTNDACDEVNDVVVNTPVDGNCDNGLFCDGPETCDAIADCQAGVPPVLDDGVACTNDSCDEVADVVVNAPDDGNCNDVDGCTTDTCDAVADCGNVQDAVCAACGFSDIHDNGTYDSVGALPTASGPWSTQGVIDDFTLTAPNTQFCSIEFFFVVPTGSTQFQDVQISIYDLGMTGISGLGEFTTTTPVFTQMYSTGDGTLLVTDTGDDVTSLISGDVLRYEAIGTTADIGAGNFGLHLTFPNATSDAGGWATAAPTAGATDCMASWGTSQGTVSDACGSLGPAYENGAFRLQSSAVREYSHESIPALAIVDNATVTDTLVTGSPACDVDEISVDVDIEHTWLGDVTMTLENVVSGTAVDLLDPFANGSGDTDLVGLYTWTNAPGSTTWDTIFSAEAPTSPGTTYLPDLGDLTDFEGDDVASDWQLSVSDGATGDPGIVNAWRIYGYCSVP